jgi:hypothetical protein
MCWQELFSGLAEGTLRANVATSDGFVIRRHGRGLLALSVDEIFGMVPRFCASRLKLLHDGVIDPVRYLGADRTPDVARLEELIRAGATLYLHNACGYFDSIRSVCEVLANMFHREAFANLYLSPSGGSAFPPHRDSHDNFVLQLSGQKAWELEFPVVSFDGDVRDQGATFIVLTAGDVLFLSHRNRHVARALARPSVHITIRMVAAAPWIRHQ